VRSSVIHDVLVSYFVLGLIALWLHILFSKFFFLSLSFSIELPLLIDFVKFVLRPIRVEFS
jgi:hypothetical protein